MKHFLSACLLLGSLAVSAQNVGIGTAVPAEKLHVAGNVRVDPLAGVGTRVVGADPNGTLVIIPPGLPGQVLTQTVAGPQFQNAGSVNIQSVSLGADVYVTTAAWSTVAGMDLVFTATKTEAMVMFSASGFAYTNSMAYVMFRVRNVTAGTTIGGTNTLTQNYDDVTGTVTPWSCSFTKKITGLTIGATYTFRVQAQRNGIYGTYDTAIWPATYPDNHHMTLSIIQ